MSKKVLICSNTSWSIYNFRFNLAKSLRKNGYKVILVAPYDEYSERLKQEFEYYNICIDNKGTNPIEDIKTIIRFYILYKNIKPDIVLNFTIKPNIYGTIVCSLLKIKTANNITGLGTLFMKQNFITIIAKYLYKYSQSKADKVFFQNKDDFELFIGEKLVKRNKSDILPGSGVDINKFKPEIYKKEDNIFKFLLISRMLWDKGIGEYVEAGKIIMKKYKNIEFQLLGFLDVDNRSAIRREQMQKWIDRGYVKYLGISDNVKEEIKKADCIVLPSFYGEGTPRILLEAASMAKPIITTNSVGCKDVVDDKVNGYLCNIKDSDDLAKKMKMMLKMSKKEQDIMGQKGREKIIREFDEKIVINKYLDSIIKIL